MMGTYVAGGAVGVALFGQSGMEQLAQAMQGDVTMGDVMKQAEQVMGLGVSATDAGVIIASLVFGMKLIDNNKALFGTLNDALRRFLKLPPNVPPPPPGV